jgi:tetratricopeptide (TPR) repeat protein
MKNQSAPIAPIAPTVPIWALAAAGLGGIVALFYFGYDQELLIRVTLGLAAAGLASCLPGLLSIRSRTMSAGGAVAVFVVVLFADDIARTFSPASKVPNVSSNVRLSRDQMQYQSEIAAAQFEISNESYDTAIEILNHTRLQNPKEPLALHMIGQLYFNKLKKYTAAAEAFKKGYELGGPDKGRFAWNLALSYDAIRSSDKAKKWIDIAFKDTSRETYPTLWDEIVYDQGLINLVSWFESGQKNSEDFQNAAEAFNKFLDHRPKIPHWANYHLACLHAMSAERDLIKQAAQAKATEHFDKFLHEIRALVGQERIEASHKIVRRVLALNDLEKTDERGPLEPVECPLIRNAWEATKHDWSDVERVFGKTNDATPPIQRADKTRPS